jgi:CarD family transcriptional regulator
MLKIGDIVVHPAHGLCRIKGLHRSRTGVSYILQTKRYTLGNVRILVPKKQAKEVGLRKPVNKKEISKVFRILSGRPKDISEDKRDGYTAIKEKLKKGNLIKIAQIVRDLEKASSARRSSVKNEILETAKRLLIEEISLVKGMPRQKVEKTVEKKLKKHGS